MEYLETLQKGGFNFDNCHRNNMLLDAGIVKENKFTKTGTTIVGVTFADGVILAADTRATAGMVMEKNCDKLHYLAPNMYCAGAGTASDCEHVTLKMRAELELQRLNTGRQSRVSTAASRISMDLFRHQGQLGAYLMIGGMDIKGPQLVRIHAGGNYSYVPYHADGSGSYNAITILESKYRDGMTSDQARDLAVEAIEAGIFHDLGSGSNVDYVEITKAGAKHHRNYKIHAKKAVEKPHPYVFKKGMTPVIRELKFTVTTVHEEKAQQGGGMEIEK